jgi:hypothetical protein
MKSSQNIKTPTRLNLTREIPRSIQQEIQNYFPGRSLSELTIRYYDSVEDVGYEYFRQKVLPACSDRSVVGYLEPFISFVRLGEALILSQEGQLFYETDGNDVSTETGPFWFVTVNS